MLQLSVLVEALYLGLVEVKRRQQDLFSFMQKNAFYKKTSISTELETRGYFPKCLIGFSLQVIKLAVKEAPTDGLSAETHK